MVMIWVFEISLWDKVTSRAKNLCLHRKIFTFLEGGALGGAR